MAVPVVGYVFVFVLFFSEASAFTLQDEMDLLRKLDVAGYASLHGMRLDRVQAVTSDGWALELHRVRNMDIYDEALSTPVFLSHGCTCSSVDFMVNPRNESLMFMLADRGYDVWAVNYRANKFSNRVFRHGRLSEPSEKDFYRATWQYMAQYDVPAALDKVLEVTRQDKLFVIGQSMGGTTLFAALSETDRFDEKILLYGALVPVIKFGEDSSATLRASFAAAPLVPRLITGELFKAVFGQQLINTEIPGVKALQEFLEETFCKNAPEVCKILGGILESTNDQNLHINMTRNELYNIVYPAGVTAMNLYQFARQYGKSEWEKLDYNEVKDAGITNYQEYYQRHAPKYNFARISVPLQVYFTKNDKYFGVETAKKLIRELMLKPSEYLMIEGNKMEHHDTVWGWDARCWVYDHLLTRMEEIENRRNYARESFRKKAERYVRDLRLEDGCRSVRA